MNTYKLRVVCEVTVDAFAPEDAVEIATDAFGEGDCGTHNITKMDVVHIEEA